MTDYERVGEYDEASSGGSGGLGTALSFLFIGLGIGAITALLLAPKSGRQMRRTLRRKYEDARELMNDLGDQAGDVVERGAKWAKETRERVAPIKKKFAD